MSRARKINGVVWVFALAAGIGAGLAFLKPVTKPAATAAVLAAKQGAEAAKVAPTEPVPVATPVRFSNQPKKSPEPQFVEAANGVYEAATKRYTALLSSGEGLRYLPKTQSEKPAELNVKLSSVTRGAETIYDRATDEFAETELAIPNGKGMNFYRTPSFTENYLPKLNGIEQTFVLDSKPVGVGPLKFECKVKLTGMAAIPPRKGRAGGIMFAAASDKNVVKYGQIMVRDQMKHGHGIVVEPTFDAASMTIAFSVPESFLDHAQYPVFVDPLVGEEFAVSVPGNPAVSNEVDQPTVCAGNGNYLVAWNDYSTINNETGQVVPVLACTVATVDPTTLNATSLAGPFAISNPNAPSPEVPLPWRFQRIEAAFDGTFWLVVWSDEGASPPGIRGALVSSGGVVSDFLIAQTSQNVLEDPIVAYNGTNFVVAWTDTPAGLNSGFQIYYAFVNTAGAAGQAFALPGSSSVQIDQALESLTAQPSGGNGDVLLIYQDETELPALHLSVRIENTGLIRDQGGTALFYQDEVLSDGSMGFGLPIGAVYNSAKTEWEILSSYDQTTDSSIFMHQLSANGAVTPPSGVFAYMGLGPSGLTRSGYDESFEPVVAGTTEWLFLRTERDTTVTPNQYHIIGKRVGFDGTDYDPVPFQIDATDVNERGIKRNAVGAQMGNVFLVAWLDGDGVNPQPGDAVSIDAAFVDATLSDVNNGAALTVTITTSPSPALLDPPPSLTNNTVSFGFTYTGTPLTYSWDFGDGTAIDSRDQAPTHKYTKAGIYIAQLTVSNGAYSVFDTVVVNVGMGGPIQVGTPLDTTPPIVSGMLITEALVKLDFYKLQDDKATITGFFDVTLLPISLVGTNVTISLSNKSYTFPLDAKGTFTSDNTLGAKYTFAITEKTGAFVFQLADENLRQTMEGLGMMDAKLPVKPQTFVTLPISMTVANSKVNLSASASVGTLYTTSGITAAGANTTKALGSATYKFDSTGNEVSGSFLVTSFSATQGTTKHSYVIKGVLVKPGAFKASSSGFFNIYLGGYHAALPGGLVLAKGATLTYSQPKATSGVTKFTLNTTTGAFLLQMIAVPADAGSGGTGLPLSKSGTGISKVDLALTFDFDISISNVNSEITAGRYVYIQRANSNATVWTLR